MTENQRRLYAFEESLSAIEVKTEPAETSTIQLQDIKIEDILPMTEVFDAVWMTDQMPEPTVSDEASEPASYNDFDASQEYKDTNDEHKRGTSSTNILKLRPALQGRLKYSTTDLEAAIQAVSENGFSIRRAAAHFNVPRTTIYRHRLKQTKSSDNVLNETFKCSFCEKDFQSKENRRQHERLSHLTEAGEFPCTVCYKVFSTKAKLHKHNYRTHEQRMIKALRLLNQHSDVKTKLVQDVDFSCDICGELIRGKQNMKKHIAGHEKTPESTPMVQRRHTTADLDAALKAVTEKGFSIRRAATQFGVPRTTFYRHYLKETKNKNVSW